MPSRNMIDKITKEEIIELIGEDPVDVLGNDWENTVEEYMDMVAEQESRWGEAQ